MRSKLLALLFVATTAVVSADGQDKVATPPSATPERKPAATSTVTVITPENEAETLAFVQEHHPELARVLGALKSMDPAEFQKAITELSTVSKNLAALKVRNPKRYEVDLDVWKTKSRVELLAAQMAGAATEELRSQLRTAIEARVDAEIRQRRFIAEQAEAAAKKARNALDYLETNRESVIEQRLRALTPKKAARPKKPAQSSPAVTPAPTSTPPSTSTKPNPPHGEDR